MDQCGDFSEPRCTRCSDRLVRPSPFRFWLSLGVWLGAAFVSSVPGRAGSLTTTVMSVQFKQPISPSSLAEQQPQALSGQSRLVITIDTKQEFHVIEGVGGAFNEIGGEALTHLDKEQRQEVLKGLFDPVTGAGFTFG